MISIIPIFRFNPSIGFFLKNHLRGRLAAEKRRSSPRQMTAQLIGRRPLLSSRQHRPELFAERQRSISVAGVRSTARVPQSC
jgi:hypothetical protein